jgi:hypothetical protein
VYNVEKGIEARWGKYVDGAKYCDELERDSDVEDRGGGSAQRLQADDDTWPTLFKSYG